MSGIKDTPEWPEKEYSTASARGTDGTVNGVQYESECDEVWNCCRADCISAFNDWLKDQKPTGPMPTPEIQELSVTAVSELIQNTAREEEELIIPVELVLMLARAICRTFGRPATFGTPSKPEPTVTQKLLKAQELHGGVASEDKLVEEKDAA